MPEWWPLSDVQNWWLGIASAVTFAGTLIGIPWLVARIRPDYFVNTTPAAESWWGRHRAVRVAALILKNALGVVLVLVGIVLLALPGQGVLTIVIGVMLLNFPGKRRFELWLVQRNSVSKGIHWIRRKAGRAPLELPDRASPRD
ncbi:MAG: PGPGW domain-containing protein [Planctomycetaceae bacterium]